MKSYIISALVLSSILTYGQYNRSNKLDSLWNDLKTKHLCFGGFQHAYHKLKNSEPINLVIDHPSWKQLVEHPKSTITPFLLTQLKDTTKTNLHTCPFFRTRRNELAIYLLQHIYNKNWYDFSEFQSFIGRKTTSSTDQPQIWLQKILMDKDQRLLMMSLWEKESSKK